ncbi:MAG: ABC transporter substrate-binding protein [Saprospiraceae bacterium]|nr:ABC transporter substrate-binding protein [Saprospiraceae bacterium]
MKRYTLHLVASLILALGMWSCGGGEASGTDDASAGNATGVTDTEIVIGSFGPLTGPAALWGNIVKGMDACFKMINEEGGINGRQIKFVMKDDAYDPSRTVPAVREMVQKDEIFALVGGIGTAPCMSVMEYVVEENIPWIPPITGATHWSIPTKKNIFAMLPYYIDEGIIQTKYALDSLGSTKIGIIYQNDDVGKSALVGARSVLKEKGLDFVAEVPVEITDTDLSSHIARLKDAEADVVLLWTLPRQGVITVTNAKVINFEPQFIASFILSDMGLMHNLTKGGWEGVIFGSLATPPYQQDDPVISKFKAAFAKFYPEDRWGLFPYSGFLYAQPFTDALKKLGDDVTREGLIEALEGMSNYDLQGLTVSFGPDDHQATRSMQLLRCKGAEEYEVVSDYIDSDSDIEALAKELEAL